MKRLALVGCVLIIGATAQAQQRSTEDGAGWYGMMLTPVGAFLPMENAGSAPRIALLGSGWKLPVSGVVQNNVGLSYLPSSDQKLRYAVTAGWLFANGGAAAKEGTLMGGASVSAPIVQNGSFEIGWRANGGFAHSSANGGTEYWSVVGQLPVKSTYRPTGSSSVFSAFASVGYGVAGVGDYADAEFGMRPLIAFGGGMILGGGLGVHVGAQQVMGDVENVKPPLVTAVAISFPLGR